MAGLYFESRLRPCWVIDTVYNKKTCLFENTEYIKALFHAFITESSLVGPSYMVGGYNGGIVMNAYALVEFEDGHVDRVDPSRIKFCDNKMREYCFDKGEKDDLQRKTCN